MKRVRPGHAPRSFPNTGVTIPSLPRSWGGPLWTGCRGPHRREAELRATQTLEAIGRIQHTHLTSGKMSPRESWDLPKISQENPGLTSVRPLCKACRRSLHPDLGPQSLLFGSEVGVHRRGLEVSHRKAHWKAPALSLPAGKYFGGQRLPSNCSGLPWEHSLFLGLVIFRGMTRCFPCPFLSTSSPWLGCPGRGHWESISSYPTPVGGPTYPWP
ncbi:PREDICTED: uncharacterized protein LOC105594178 [Cercocebus atys]|uniref:uncharacterized protein LOC105594178 n=1 Tax=Cercocebus atys TaxID=9531 RepID=UPI0005F4CF62|nr:PREDICTED: uncharacterized protein LOC105594178 [Cercocebus atys]